MRINNEKGVSLVMTLFFATILFGLSAVFISSVVNESNSVQKDLSLSKAFYASQGGGESALMELDTLINNYLLNTVANSEPSAFIAYTQQRVDAAEGIEWLVFSVRDNNVPVLTQNGDQAEYTQNGTLGDSSYQYEIVLTEQEDPFSSGLETWDFPFNFKITVTGLSDDVSSTVYLSGDFVVRAQRDNFAKYASFTNEQTTPSGQNVWFTDSTNFSGPVHTNDRFNFALNPSGSFYDVITEVEQQARFYDNGNPILLDADVNGTTDVPAFYSGFTRGVTPITLSSPTNQLDMVNQATGGNTYGSNGIYVPNDGISTIGGIYVNGNSTIDLSVDASNNAVYNINQAGLLYTITVDQIADQTIVDDITNGTSATYIGAPDGIDDVGTLIYVEGNIDSIGGTVQHNTELTVSSDSDMVITDNIVYQNYISEQGNPGDPDYVPPNADNEINMLGLVTWNGHARIGTAAPDDISIHGSILAQTGIFTVDNYDDQSVGPRGTATLLGGVISDNYGAFGLFNGDTGQQLSGFGRNYAYDERMAKGKAPPYYPSLDAFIATADLPGTVTWQEGN